MPIVGLVVEAIVSEGRMDEFLKLMEADAVASRKEPGCLRFGESKIVSQLHPLFHIIKMI